MRLSYFVVRECRASNAALPSRERLVHSTGTDRQGGLSPCGRTGDRVAGVRGEHDEAGTKLLTTLLKRYAKQVMRSDIKINLYCSKGQIKLK